MNSLTPRPFTLSLERAVVATLAYFDVFDFPVQAADLHRYLHGLQVSYSDLETALQSPGLSTPFEFQDGYYVLAGRRSLIDPYEAAAQQNARRLHLALRYGRQLARLPFIRMVAVTGSVAMQNGGSAPDFDYLLVTEPDRLWLARLFAVAFGRWVRLQGHTLCPNIVISERALVWRRQDLYTAHELTQMIPVSGLQAYQRLRQRNSWTQSYLPNAVGAPYPETADQHARSLVQDSFEPLLRTALGSAFERLEMTRKISRFRRQPGFGVETVFTPDVCQGNFQHHDERVGQAFERRLIDLGLAPALSSALFDPGSRPARSSIGATPELNAPAARPARHPVAPSPAIADE